MLYEVITYLPGRRIIDIGAVMGVDPLGLQIGGFGILWAEGVAVRIILVDHPAVIIAAP